jgi:hypothetical protein
MSTFATVDERWACPLFEEGPISLPEATHALCVEIEKLPASEQQTKVSILANEIYEMAKAKGD